MNELIVRPVVNLLLLCYQWLGHQTILAVVVVTLLFRLVLTPLTLSQRLSQQKVAHKRQVFQSRIKELQEEYKDDPVKLAEAQLKFYQEMTINPVGGCLMTLIQLPILIGLYRAIAHIMATTPLQLLELPAQIYTWIPNLSAVIPIHSRFLWLDLGARDPYFILPALVFGISWLRQKISLPSADDKPQEKWSKYLDVAISLLVTYFAASYAAGLAIYILLASLSDIFEYMLFVRPRVAKLQARRENQLQPAAQPTTEKSAIST